MSQQQGDRTTADQQEEQELTNERVGMDRSDIDDAIDHEHDQKVEPGDDSRYEDDVERALSDEGR